MKWRSNDRACPGPDRLDVRDVVLDVRDANPGHPGKARIDMAELSRTGAKLELPAEVSRVADNYNHLHEQPTIFYALALAAGQLGGAADAANIAGSPGPTSPARIAHSLVQATRNVIPVRFAVFSLGSILLLILLVRTALRLA